jgi:hypothetical protein
LSNRSAILEQGAPEIPTPRGAGARDTHQEQPEKSWNTGIKKNLTLDISGYPEKKWVLQLVINWIKTCQDTGQFDTVITAIMKKLDTDVDCWTHEMGKMRRSSKTNNSVGL